jgi:hypothetical protein
LLWIFCFKLLKNNGYLYNKVLAEIHLTRGLYAGSVSSQGTYSGADIHLGPCMLVFSVLQLKRVSHFGLLGFRELCSLSR